MVYFFSVFVKDKKLEKMPPKRSDAEKKKDSEYFKQRTSDNATKYKQDRKDFDKLPAGTKEEKKVQEEAVLSFMRGLIYEKTTEVPIPCRTNSGYVFRDKQTGEIRQNPVDLTDPKTFRCAFDKWRTSLGYKPEEYPILEAKYDEEKDKAAKAQQALNAADPKKPKKPKKPTEPKTSKK